MQIVNLTKVYNKGKENERVALDNVSFNLPNKGLIFILGKSGSGKSTLLNLLGAIDTPTSGKIIVGSKDITLLKEKEKADYRASYCGFVFQDYNLILELNVWDNIALNLEKYEEEKINEVLDLVGLLEYKNSKINELSGGQAQRISIARALVKNPKVIFLDEPTAALDNETGREILKLLKKLSLERLIVVVSHNEEFANIYSQRTIKLENGKIIDDTEKTQENSNDILKLKRRRLSFKNMLMLSKTTLKGNKLRLTMTIILLLLTSIVMILSFNMAFYSIKDNFLKKLEENNIEYTVCGRYQKYIANNYDYGFSGLFLDDYHKMLAKRCYLTKEDIANTFNMKYSMYYKKIVFYEMQDTMCEKRSDLLNYENKKDPNKDYSSPVSGILNVNNLDSFNYKMLTGRLPNKSDEIAIPNSFYNFYELTGFRDLIHNKKYEITKPEDLIGKQINYTANGTYNGDARDVYKIGYKTIVGVVDISENDYYKENETNYSSVGSGINVKDSLFVYDGDVSYYNCAILKVNSEIQHIIEMGIDSKLLDVYYLDDPVSIEIYSSLDFSYELKNIALALGIILSIITILIAMYYVKNIVIANTWNMGIISSLGYTWVSNFLIVLIPLLVIGICVGLLSACMVPLANYFLNIKLFNYTYLKNIISNKFLANIIGFGVIEVTLTISCLLNVRVFKRKSSIELIKSGKIK